MTKFNTYQLHSLFFALIVVISVVLSMHISSANQPSILIALVVIVIVLGVPHGALDTLFARQYWQLETINKWLLFLLCYTGLASAVVVFWMFQPLLFFISFLVVSIVHFSDDLQAGTGLITRLLYGGAIIVLPTLFHAQQIAQIFSYFISHPIANTLVNGLHLVTYGWLIGLIAVCVTCAKNNIYTSLEIASVTLLAVFATPLLAFTVYFCGMHSLSKTRKKTQLIALTIPTIIVCIVAAFALPWLQMSSLDIQLLQLLFAVLAALTLPHMLLLQLSGFNAWIKR